MSVIQEISMIVKNAQARTTYQTGISVPLSLYGGKGRMIWGGGNPKDSVGGVPVRKWEDLPSTRIMRGASNPKVSTSSEHGEINSISRNNVDYKMPISVPMSVFGGGNDRIIWGGGKNTSSVGGVSSRKWEDLPSTKIMRDSSNPKVNTPAVRRQKMMAYMPNAFRSSTSKPVSRQTGVASSPGQKFDFRGEAIKLLKSYGANASRAKGRYSTDIGRNMINQWKDMQANPQKYDEARQRQILDQWRSSIAQMRAGSSPQANPRSIASAPRKQQPVEQTAKSL